MKKALLIVFTLMLMVSCLSTKPPYIIVEKSRTIQPISNGQSAIVMYEYGYYDSTGMKWYYLSREELSIDQKIIGSY